MVPCEGYPSINGCFLALEYEGIWFEAVLRANARILQELRSRVEMNEILSLAGEVNVGVLAVQAKE